VLSHFERRSTITNIIVFVGLLVIFNATGSLLFGHELKQFPSPFLGMDGIFSKFMPSHGIGSIAIMLCMLALVFSFFKFSSVGLAMRASAYNRDSAFLVGINVSWMLALAWGLAAAVGGVAGMMIAPVVYLDSGMMGSVLLYGFAAALLGGIQNPWGAVIGGFIVGIAENLLGAYVTGTDLKLTVALLLIVLTLTLRPDGIFGKAIARRV
jgi:branched-chain amino acid transport system permease protein